MNSRPFPLALSCVMLLAACSGSHDVIGDLPDNSLAGAPRDDMSETRIEGTIARPVTIGEDGPRLDACGTLGVVLGPGGKRELDLRAAPFAAAKQLASLPAGTRVHVCTRSIDQRWLGVVVQPVAPEVVTGAGNAAGADAVDCGVSSPVEQKQVYDGPCQSGWVSSAFVRMVAG